MTDHTKAVPSTEFAPDGVWFKSSYSDQGGGNCVEVADCKTKVGVRDSKNTEGPALTLPRETFLSFIDSVKSGAITSGVVD
ncbi:DUF397 domain-containing protein [Streptomyces sp. NPDC005962]|uniref:DUF397 domain-containing protein n=1 Tax=Streptomyces sp. NPDC005962 TaxID=3154466 RepID=UPI0033FA3FA9